MEIVWLPSYPKSGNIWLRFLFTNLFHGPFEHSQTIFEVTPVLERGIDPAHLREDRVNMIKTHHMFSPELPYMEHAMGAVYIVRNPFDVMMSNLNYFFLSSDAAVGKTEAEIQDFASRYVDTYLQHGGDPRWRNAKYGSWQEHIRSWTENPSGMPVSVVRYEDLLADTAAVLARICEFIGFEASGERIEDAVSRSSFATMKAFEEREIKEKRPGMFYYQGRESSNGMGYRFMNKGKSGSALDALTPGVMEKFRTVFTPLIDELGYA